MAARDLGGFTVTATTEPDPAPDTDWLGTFTATWSPDAIDVGPRDAHPRRDFLPAYTATRRRADLSRRGYSRELAVRGVRLTRSLDHLLVRVEASKTGVLLAAVVTAIDLAPGDEVNATIVRVIEECDMVGEAVDHAHGALPPLIAALAA